MDPEENQGDCCCEKSSKVGLRKDSFTRTGCGTQRPNCPRTGRRAGSNFPCIKRTGNSRDWEGGSSTACPEVQQRFEDQRSADTCQPTGAALDNLEGRETFYLHSALCLVSLASNMLGLTPF